MSGNLVASTWELWAEEISKNFFPWLWLDEGPKNGATEGGCLKKAAEKVKKLKWTGNCFENNADGKGEVSNKLRSRGADVLLIPRPHWYSTWCASFFFHKDYCLFIILF